MTTKIRAQATTIVLFALVMGVFWGTWFSLAAPCAPAGRPRRSSPSATMIRNLGVPMAILMPLALLSAGRPTAGRAGARPRSGGWRPGSGSWSRRW